eukprot:m.19792 g.19792  ORF g.19792 m.19792 type:complete len:117 (-) comp8085_c0_seq3:2357-2707(-)
MSLCVGLLVSDKKFAALNLQEFVDIAKGKSVRVVRIDLKQPLEHQGPFDVIVHKLTNLEALALLGDAEAAGHVASIKVFDNRLTLTVSCWQRVYAQLVFLRGAFVLSTSPFFQHRP